MIKETEIKVTNDTILLRSLRNDIIEAQTRLSGIYAEAKYQEKIIERKNLDLGDLQKEKSDLFMEMKAERDSVQLSHKDLENAKIRSEKELLVLKNQKKESMSELRKLNEWNSNAREEKDGLKLVITELLELEKDKKLFVQDIKDVKELLDEKNEEYRLALVEVDLLKVDAEAFNDKNSKRVGILQEEVKVLEKKKEMSEIELADTLIYKKKVEVDLNIYQQRIQKEYEKTFPEKIMPLTKK